jgi:hypothetical protein
MPLSSAFHERFPMTDHSHGHHHGHHHKPSAWKQPKTWGVVGTLLALLAMAVYVLTQDESIQPELEPENPPASANP